MNLFSQFRQGPSRALLPLGAALLISACGGASGDTTDTAATTTASPTVTAPARGYPVVGTNQSLYYDHSTAIAAPSLGQSFHGQNAHYPGNVPRYQNHGDGTVSDLVSGLMWQQSPDRNGDGKINASDKLYFDEAMSSAAALRLAGYSDWRLPTIKELYSLIQLSGADPNPNATTAVGSLPFLDTQYFDFGYGDLDANERIIDAQYASATEYVSTTMQGNKTMFGVNFADGRIKGYPSAQSIGKKYYVRYVRGNTAYGKNEFADNGDGTITDQATGLMWMKNDGATAMSWQDALSYAEGWVFSGHSDWRLPDVKELQSIVDYTRSPATSGSAAISPLFISTPITNEASEPDYAAYWSNSTHAALTPQSGKEAAYVCFGKCLGFMYGAWIDVHGAGAQRSDPKEGDPKLFPMGFGPQGDAIRIKNFVRLVRTAK